MIHQEVKMKFSLVSLGLFLLSYPVFSPEIQFIELSKEGKWLDHKTTPAKFKKKLQSPLLGTNELTLNSPKKKNLF
jgi:hypothetical protein